MESLNFATVESRYNFPGAREVAGIAPVDGYSLFTYDELDGDGFVTPAYFARGPWRDVKLAVSRFQFTPTQGRFEFLVRNGFPQFPGMGNWSDAEIDEALLGGWQVAA